MNKVNIKDSQNFITSKYHIEKIMNCISLEATCQVKCNSKLEKISEGEFQLRHLRGR